MHPLAQLDHAHVWHPFTQMRDWLRQDPIVIVRGKGTTLEDANGRVYLDANSSIWTNLHGHQHPAINRAIRAQLGKIAHSSALGLANEPASRLAGRLVEAAQPPAGWRNPNQPRLSKVFYSDDGSTALEVSVKLAYEFVRRSREKTTAPRFLSIQGAYHGDTIGAVSLGHIDLFHRAYSGLLFKTDEVPSPYCYRCPFNRAKPERTDARTYRKCEWECVGKVEQAFEKAAKQGKPYTALTVEPGIQGAAGMVPQPDGWLGKVARIARGHRALLIADEVLTGFGRTGSSETSPTLWACHHEQVQPDFLNLAKGLTGGYLPMAATLTTDEVFDAFLGEYEELKTFFHGHSYTGNQLGAAAALASLDLLERPANVKKRRQLEQHLRGALESLWSSPHVGDIRQVGLIAGVELVEDWRSRKSFDFREKAGIRVVDGMARRGVLTRHIGNTIVLMPPYCTTPSQLDQMVAALSESIQEALPGTTRGI
jgi:adenosylmethionine---8-amino-7-oxononanoate aminotransferase